MDIADSARDSHDNNASDADGGDGGGSDSDSDKRTAMFRKKVEEGGGEGDIIGGDMGGGEDSSFETPRGGSVLAKSSSLPHPSAGPISKMRISKKAANGDSVGGESGDSNDDDEEDKEGEEEEEDGYKAFSSSSSSSYVDFSEAMSSLSSVKGYSPTLTHSPTHPTRPPLSYSYILAYIH